jgi:hypothetical protein
MDSLQISRFHPELPFMAAAFVVDTARLPSQAPGAGKRIPAGAQPHRSKE